MRRHPAPIGATAMALLISVTAIAAVSVNSVPGLPVYKLRAPLPQDAPAMSVGMAVKVAGQRVGAVSELRPTDHGAAMTLEMRRGPVGRDAQVRVRLETATGKHYVEVDRGNYRQAPLESGSALSSDQVTVGVDLSAVVHDFGRRSLRSVAAATKLTGLGFAGRGERLNRALTDADRTAARTTGLLSALTQNGDLAGLTSAVSRTADQLAGRRPGDAGRAVAGGGEVLGTLGDGREDIVAALRSTPAVEDEALRTLPVADPVLTDATRLAQRLLPAARALRAALPAVNDLLLRGRDLRRSVPAIATAAIPALRRLRPVLRRVAASAAMLGAASGPLGPFAGYLARFPQELEAGFGAFYNAFLYRPDLGQAPGTPAAPVMLIFTCAKAYNLEPDPGDIVSERTSKRCTP